MLEFCPKRQDEEIGLLKMYVRIIYVCMYVRLLLWRITIMMIMMIINMIINKLYTPYYTQRHISHLVVFVVCIVGIVSLPMPSLSPSLTVFILLNALLFTGDSLWLCLSFRNLKYEVFIFIFFFFSFSKLDVKIQQYQ